MPSFLYLFRHGHIETCGKVVGRADYPLSPLGISQAQVWAREFRRVTFQAAWSSPLSRASQTAEVILAAQARPPKLSFVPAFMEISMGEWEGVPKDQVRDSWKKAWAARGADFSRVSPPGGENFLQMAARALPAFFAVCRQAETVTNSILVAHCSINQLFLAFLMAWPLENLRCIPQPYAAVCKIQLPLPIDLALAMVAYTRLG